MQSEKLREFFDTHATVDEVHLALGVLFIDQADANTYLAGVNGYVVETFTREQIEGAADADIDAEIAQAQADAAATQKALDEENAINAIEEDAVEDGMSGPAPEN